MILNFKETRKPRSQVGLEVAVSDANPLMGGFTVSVEGRTNGYTIGTPKPSIIPATSTISPPTSFLIHSGVYPENDIEEVKELFKKQLIPKLTMTTITKGLSSFKLRGI